MMALARYNANGSLHVSFGAGGRLTTLIGPESSAAEVLVLADGRILVGGTSDSNFAVVRYLSDGRLDPTFDGDGVATLNDVPIAVYFVRGMALQANGQIVLAGSQYFSSPTNPDFYELNVGLVRLNADGSLDTSFGGVGWVTTDFNPSSDRDRDDATAIAIQADGKIIVAGSSDASGSTDFALARYDGDAPAAGKWVAPPAGAETAALYGVDVRPARPVDTFSELVAGKPADFDAANWPWLDPDDRPIRADSTALPSRKPGPDREAGWLTDAAGEKAAVL